MKYIFEDGLMILETLLHKWTVTNNLIFRCVRTIYQVFEDTYPHILTANHILISAYEQFSNDSSCARGIRLIHSRAITKGT